MSCHHSPPRFFRGEAWACFILRMAIGMRLILAGVTKFMVQDKEFNWVWDNEAAATKMEQITAMISANSPLSGRMMELYEQYLPWALIIVGAWVVVGLFTRTGLVMAGLTILSLAFGLLFIGEDVEGTFRFLEIIVIALALIVAKHNILAVDNLIEFAIGGDRGEEDDDAPRRQKD